MSKPVIAVDIDDVLADSASRFITYSNKKWNLQLTIEDYDEHLGKMWQVDEAEAEVRIKEYHDSNIWLSYRHDIEAVEVLFQLSKKYTLIITTSRNKSIDTVTRNWIDQHFKVGTFSDVRFAGIWDSQDGLEDRIKMTKSKLCQEINASYLIDDQPKHCLAAAEAGIQSLLFGDYPWNRTIKNIDKITRVNDWRDIKSFFDAR